MKAKELAAELLKNPDFDVETNILSQCYSTWGVTLNQYIVNGINDIGYSDKVILLDIVLRDET